jgi:hypothetical protein
MQISSVTSKRRDNAFQPDSTRTWDPGVQDKIHIQVQDRLYALIATTVIADVHGTDENEDDDDSNEESRTELDSHANMPVVGRHAYILSDNGRTADVSAFTPDYKPMEVRIVDAAVQYECPYSSETYVLVIRNALHVPSMKSNLIPPFIMRETGIQVNETAKIHRDDPSVEIIRYISQRRSSGYLWRYGVSSHTSQLQSQVFRPCKNVKRHMC